MTPEELIVALYQTLTQHLKLPAGFEWAPLAGMGLVTAFGLILLLRGARWAPALAAVTFIGIGGCAGSFLSHAIGTPFWPTVAVVGVLGFVLGLVMFRFWQAILLAACFMIAGLSVYFVHTLTPEVQNWISATPQSGLITLRDPGTVVGEHQSTAWIEFKSLWTHLEKNVPNFSATAWTLVLSTGLAGLIFGLLLPGVSRALWAASLGTLFFGIGITAALSRFAPSVLDWLKTNHDWAWGIVGIVWLLSLALNLVTGRRKTPEKQADDTGAQPKSKAAMA
jgi:xanthosine utilization system XapX-like protein